MKRLFDKKIEFSCGCRDWVIFESDEAGITEPPKERFTIDHECEKIIVYRKYKGLKRYFLNKLKQSER